MREIWSVHTDASKRWTRRRVVVLGLLISGGTARGAWLAGETGAKKKRRKSKKKTSGEWGLLPANYGVDAVEQEFLNLINSYRTEKGVRALVLNQQLNASAASHSLDMGQNNFFDHVNKQKKDAGNRASAAGYRWAVIGENIAAGVDLDTATEAFAMLKSSPEHNQNMLDRDFRDIGIGREQVPGSQYGWYWTTVFGATS